MARVFLDANTLIDLLESQTSHSLLDTTGHLLAVSPLSLHILAYLYKYPCPSEILQAASAAFTIVPLDAEVLRLAALGPTADFEDNIQLQSASASGCSYFITSDRSLLRLGVFGKTRIVASLP
jgi:predicted nucleic acid-binding protein